MQQPSISIVGSGNVAWHLARAFSASGFEIREIFGRNQENTEDLARLCGAKAKNLSGNIDSTSDVLLLCLPDQAVLECRTQMQHLSSVLIHTAGTLGMEELKHKAGYGVFYPLQTFTKGFDLQWNKIPILIEASDPKVLGMLELMGRALSERVESCSSERRRHLHLAAVWACNYSNHMMEIASGILKEQGDTLVLMDELIRETTRKVLNIGPEKAQTGPAIRRDNKVIQAHLALLKDESLKSLYQMLVSSIQTRHPRD